MFRIKIFKDGVRFGGGDFADQASMNAWFDTHEQLGVFSTNDKTVTSIGLDGVETVEVISATHTFTITDVTAELETAAVKEAKISAGKAAREACLAVLDYIAGCNLDKELSIEQITSMQQTFASAEAALKAGRPTFARNFIEAIQPDGYILTEEEKAECLLLLTGY